MDITIVYYWVSIVSGILITANVILDIAVKITMLRSSRDKQENNEK